MESKIDTKNELKYKPKKKNNIFLYIILVLLAILFLAPIFIVLYNSFKGKLYISRDPFALPNSTTFSGISNYINGIEKTGFLSAIGYSLFITISSTVVIILFTSMTAWYIIRVKSKFTTFLYYLFVFSMVVPFQMVMFTMSKIANILNLDNPLGIIVIYLGFGAGQYLRGGYGAVDMGAMMAVLVLAIIPIIIFYFTCQKYIIEGIAAGAVKG